jgi:hypothetical protein
MRGVESSVENKESLNSLDLLLLLDQVIAVFKPNVKTDNFVPEPGLNESPFFLSRLS